MFKALFNIIINLLATVIQIIVSPINALMVATFPNISSYITSSVSNILSSLSGLSYAISFIPVSLKVTLALLLTIEIAKHTIFNNTYMLTRVWTVIQKIKFW